MGLLHSRPMVSVKHDAFSYAVLIRRSPGGMPWSNVQLPVVQVLPSLSTRPKYCNFFSGIHCAKLKHFGLLHLMGFKSLVSTPSGKSQRKPTWLLLIVTLPSVVSVLPAQVVFGSYVVISWSVANPGTNGSLVT
jgi:hypothetical protein